MQANARYVHLRPNIHRKYIFFKFALRHNYSLKTDRQTDRQTGKDRQKYKKTDRYIESQLLCERHLTFSFAIAAKTYDK